MLRSASGRLMPPGNGIRVTHCTAARAAWNCRLMLISTDPRALKGGHSGDGGGRVEEWQKEERPGSLPKTQPPVVEERLQAELTQGRRVSLLRGEMRGDHAPGRPRPQP